MLGKLYYGQFIFCLYTHSKDFLGSLQAVFNQCNGVISIWTAIRQHNKLHITFSIQESSTYYTEIYSDIFRCHTLWLWVEDNLGSVGIHCETDISKVLDKLMSPRHPRHRNSYCLVLHIGIILENIRKTEKAWQQLNKVPSMYLLR